jgi:hypothetical protein
MHDVLKMEPFAADIISDANPGRRSVQSIYAHKIRLSNAWQIAAWTISTL